MPDRTGEFREIYRTQSQSQSAASTLSDSKGRDGQQRQRQQDQTRADALRRHRKRKQWNRVVASSSTTSSNASTPAIDLSDPDLDVWTLEASQIIASLRSLALFLNSIRRAYLDLSSSSSSSSSHEGKGRAINGSFNDGGSKSREELDLSKGLLEAWKDVKWLNDRERDEVDWQAKTVLKRCIERVRELEQAEKNRHAKAAQLIGSSSTMSASSRANQFSRLLGLPALLPSNDAEKSEEMLHAHRSQVSLYIGRRLADVGRVQKEQQEVRVLRQLERQSMSTAGAAGAIHVSGPASGAGGSKGKAREDDGAIPAIFVPDPIQSSQGDPDGYGYGGEDEDYTPIDSLLSQSQIQQFESESSALLQEANSALASIEKAQTSLLEISSLQSELAVHLTQQMELTDQLWEDSVMVSGRVDEGNKQLKEARERNKEGRLWLLVFLLGASFSLLFLEYY